MDRIIQRLELLDVLASAALLDRDRGAFVGNRHDKWQSASKHNLAVENPNRFCWTDPKMVQNILGLTLGLRLDSCMYNCCFHEIGVSHPQHIRKSFLLCLANDERDPQFTRRPRRVIRSGPRSCWASLWDYSKDLQDSISGSDDGNDSGDDSTHNKSNIPVAEHLVFKILDLL